MAADVAAATMGFAGQVHIPKGMMFIIGLLSMIVAAGLLDALTMFAGGTTKLEGAVPKEHFNIAPAVTSCGIQLPFLSSLHRHISVVFRASESDCAPLLDGLKI